MKKKKPRTDQEELASRIQGHLDALGGPSSSPKKKKPTLGDGPRAGFESQSALLQKVLGKMQTVETYGGAYNNHSRTSSPQESEIARTLT